MKEYIERAALEIAFEAAEEDDIELYGVHICECFPAERACEIARTIPAADVVERKRGEWVGEADGYADGELVYDVWYCSECNHCIDDGTDDPDLLPNYCPNCGADMRRG